MAGTNPLVDQGVLNRLRVSLLFPSFPSLNVSASFLGKSQIRVTPEGESTQYIPTATGAARSQEPYMLVSVAVALLKTQPLSDAYKKKLESDAFLGECTVRPDSSKLSPFVFYNVSISNVGDLPFDGTQAEFNVTLKGYWPINSALWNAS